MRFNNKIFPTSTRCNMSYCIMGNNALKEDAFADVIYLITNNKIVVTDYNKKN